MIEVTRAGPDVCVEAGLRDRYYPDDPDPVCDYLKPAEARAIARQMIEIANQIDREKPPTLIGTP